MTSLSTTPRSVGAELGESDVGFAEGTKEGNAVGAELCGGSVGATLGLCDGNRLGHLDGAELCGARVGMDCSGDLEGRCVGLLDGIRDGSSDVGALDGIRDGSSDDGEKDGQSVG